jgi:hypothetical protein
VSSREERGKRMRGKARKRCCQPRLNPLRALRMAFCRGQPPAVSKRGGLLWQNSESKTAKEDLRSPVCRSFASGKTPGGIAAWRQCLSPADLSFLRIGRKECACLLAVTGGLLLSAASSPPKGEAPRLPLMPRPPRLRYRRVMAGLPRDGVYRFVKAGYNSRMAGRNAGTARAGF